MFCAPRIRSRVLVIPFVAALLLASTLSASAAPPATNDDFDDATIVSPAALPFVDEVETDGATAEGGEAASACGGATDHSVWWQISPASTMYIRADTFGSGDDSDLTVYRGMSLGSLTEVACARYLDVDDDARITFKAVGGRRYYIRVTESTGLTVLRLRRVSPPSNDAFASARLVPSLPWAHATSTVNATIQPGEPDPNDIGGCADTGPTVWYKLVPSRSMIVRVDTFAAAFDTWIAAYRGTTLGGLTPLLCNDDTSTEGSGLQSNIAFRVTAGQTYHVQVGGFNRITGDLAVRFRRGQPPANDGFGNAEAIVADGSRHAVDSTRAATIQGGEPSGVTGTCATASSLSTVWYVFDAPATADFLFDTVGSSYRTNIAVYTGSSLSALTEQACVGRDTEVTFSATSGVTYWIQVAGYYGDSGHLLVHLAPV